MCSTWCSHIIQVSFLHMRNMIESGGQTQGRCGKKGGQELDFRLHYIMSHETYVMFSRHELIKGFKWVKHKQIVSSSFFLPLSSSSLSLWPQCKYRGTWGRSEASWEAVEISQARAVEDFSLLKAMAIVM